MCPAAIHSIHDSCLVMNTEYLEHWIMITGCYLSATNVRSQLLCCSLWLFFHYGRLVDRL